MNSSQDTLSQPKALYLIVAVQMWECFSFYGMRVLLVLYMISQLNFSDSKAFGIFALYTGLVELGGILGGIVADRLLGLRRAIILGGWLILAGHLSLAFGSRETFFFPALALIIVGSSFFSTNLSALLGQFYKKEDSRRESGFTLFYAGINLGSLLATLLCGYVGDHLGWHYGFGLAAIGMLFGIAIFHLFQSILEDKGSGLQVQNKVRLTVSMIFFLSVAVYLVSQGLEFENAVLPFLPWICLSTVGYVAIRLLNSDVAGPLKLSKLVIYILGLSLFFAAEEQMGSSLTLFTERHATKTLLNIPLPSSILLSINPAVIIFFGIVMNFLRKFHFEQIPRIVLPFLLASASYAILTWSCEMSHGYEPVPILLIMGAVLIISLAELMIGPTVYSFCSEVASKGNQGMVMGLVPIGFSLASAIGGFLSKLMAVEDSSKHTLTIYQEGFMTIAIILLVAGGIIAAGLLYLKSEIQELKI